MAFSLAQDEDTDEHDSGLYRGDVNDLARDLVDKVGIDAAIRYCHGLGWRGVLEQIELLRRQRNKAE